jgi:3-hydroxyisobutyrate dehydrogenase
MGEPMGHRLLDAGYRLNVYNRTAEKTSPLAGRGAPVYNEAGAVISESEILITMLSDFPAIQEAMLPLPPQAAAGKIWIQMSTIKPSESLILQEQWRDAGGGYLEAPVLGSIPQVKTGTLFVLVGGEEDLLKECSPLLELLGESIVRFGDVGTAAAAKLALNQLIASLTAGFSMSLGYLREKNVDIDQFMTILRGSALYAPTFDKKLEKMMQRDFRNPNFPVKHMLKDVNLMLEDFGDASIDTAPLAGVCALLETAMNNGDQDMDYSALYNAAHPKKK